MDGSFWKSERVPGEVELAIGRAGDGREPVLCLHGITAQHRAFNALARYLGPSGGVIGMDLRGRGDSGKPETNYGLEAHAADVIRVLDHLGLQSAVLAGHSMGGFVALETALTYPDRVRAIALLDSGWPRPETAPEEDASAAIDEGLERAFRRLDMTFESLEAYLDFWFPDQNLTMDDLPPDLADYYRYDLAEGEEGYTPKASIAAAREDTPDVSENSPTTEELCNVRCPVALVRASEGFFAGSDPLISDETSKVMANALGLRSDTVVEGANHYTMLWPDHTPAWAPQVFDPPFWEE